LLLAVLPQAPNFAQPAPLARGAIVLQSQLYQPLAAWPCSNEDDRYLYRIPSRP